MKFISFLSSILYVVECLKVDISDYSSHDNFVPLIFLGDWGKGGIVGDITTKQSSGSSNQNGNKVDYTYQYAVAKSMAQFAKYHRVEAIIGLGDNFYNDGVKSIYDSLWITIWKQVYNSFKSLQHVPWYTVLGNHDYGYGDVGVQAQIQQSHTTNASFQNWKTPATNYSLDFSINARSKAVIICIDTTTLSPSVNQCCNEKGGISTAVQSSRIQNQLMHIEIMLNESRQDASVRWIVVAGHYPVFSCGEHLDNSELIAYLLPLMEKYQVDMYISGHDHISEHLSYGSIEYIVAGSGALLSGLYDKSKATLQWSGVGYSTFLSMNITENNLTFTFIDINGKNVYTKTLFSKDPLPPYVPSNNSLNDTSSETSSYQTKSDSGNESTVVVVAFVSIGAAVMILAGVGYSLARRQSKVHEKALRHKNIFFSHIQSHDDDSLHPVTNHPNYIQPGMEFDTDKEHILGYKDMEDACKNDSHSTSFTTEPPDSSPTSDPNELENDSLPLPVGKPSSAGHSWIPLNIEEDEEKSELYPV